MLVCVTNRYEFHFLCWTFSCYLTYTRKGKSRVFDESLTQKYYFSISYWQKCISNCHNTTCKKMKLVFQPLWWWRITIHFFVCAIMSRFCRLCPGPRLLNDIISGLKVTQARRRICFNPACQSCMPQLFRMFLLISIMKGLIMLMRRPNDLVLTVEDTAVGLRAKSCAKCVT